MHNSHTIEIPAFEFKLTANKSYGAMEVPVSVPSATAWGRG
jgi:hypothetical protein